MSRLSTTCRDLHPVARTIAACTVLLVGWPAAAGDLPACAIVVTGAAAERAEMESRVAIQLAERCRPVRSDALADFLDGRSVDAEGPREARAALDGARDAFLAVRLGEAVMRARRAIELYGQCHAALDSYEEIAAAHVFLGVLELELGHRDAARGHFHQALAIDSDFRPDPAVVPPAALEAFSAARKTLFRARRGALTIRTRPAGADLWLDGSPLGRSPTRLEHILPGRHYLRARLDGHLSQDRSLEVGPGASEKLEIALTPSPRLLLAEPGERTQGILATVSAGADFAVLVWPEPEKPAGMWRAQLYRVDRAVLEPRTTLGALLRPAEPEIEIGDGAIGPEPPPFVPTGDQGKGDAEPGGSSVLESWWLWTAVGAVLVSTAVLVPVLTADRSRRLHITVIRD
ncbi:MAG: PEGA domain-containing protein [Deltaproteobacteria bacterium]|nr:PEGA domain-containing protein [Deltaproteobacteria bacterium]